MVLEGLKVLSVERKPWEALVSGSIYVFVAAFLSLILFPESASIVSVLLVVVASLPLVYDAIKFEEKVDLKYSDEHHIIEHHKLFVWFVLFLFLGFSLGFFLLYSFLPSTYVNQLFSAQISTIQSVNSTTGNYVSLQGAFFSILFNNIKVLAFCLLFSFLYGSGAIFILSWNASVLGAAMGNFFRETLSKMAPSLSSYFAVGTLSLLRYFIHGIPEITAYLLAGLAGSLISTAVVNNDFRTKRFYKVLDDSTDLILLSLILLFVAALLEVFITPLFF